MLSYPVELEAGGLLAGNFIICYQVMSMCPAGSIRLIINVDPEASTVGVADIFETVAGNNVGCCNDTPGPLVVYTGSIQVSPSFPVVTGLFLLVSLVMSCAWTVKLNDTNSIAPMKIFRNFKIIPPLPDAFC